MGKAYGTGQFARWRTGHLMDLTVLVPCSMTPATQTMLGQQRQCSFMPDAAVGDRGRHGQCTGDPTSERAGPRLKSC